MAQGKRAVATLLLSVALLYAAILAGVYLYASGKDIRTVLFGNDASEKDVVLSAGDEMILEPVQTVRENDNRLPPLEEGAADEFPTESNLPITLQAAPSPEKSTPRPMQPEPPPVPVPGVAFSSKLSPIKCWDQRGFEYASEDCDALGRLSKLAEYHLDMIEGCRAEIDGTGNAGTFAVFAEADFVRNSITLWPGTASTLRGADKIAECVTERWRSLPFLNVPHRFVRYRLKGTVRFDGALRRATEPMTVTPSRVIDLQKAAEDAKEVTVSRDRVRVRKSPVSGEIIGFISTGQKVKLIEVTDEWCLVQTKRGNVGWMICWGLDLQASTESPPAPEKK